MTPGVLRQWGLVGAPKVLVVHREGKEEGKESWFLSPTQDATFKLLVC